VRLPHFKVQHRRTVLRALALYAQYPIDFGDAMIVANMVENRATLLYSYDHDFDRVPGITRQEP
jgi:predicted nucleic acid-binding protein